MTPPRPSSPDPEQEERVLATCDRPLRSGELPPNTVRSLIEDSWLRCHRAGVDPDRAGAAGPLVEDDSKSPQERDRELAHAGKAVMAQARDLLSQSGTIMMLTGATGVILEAEGDLGTLDAASDIRLVTGADWNEFSCGTNAIGTALSVGGSVQVHGSEHFCAGMKPWTCSATVVRDPADGQVLGVLDASGLKGTFTRHLLALVVAAAGRIEMALAARELERRQRLLENGLGHIAKVGSGGLILFDRKGRLVKADDRARVTLAAIGLAPDGDAPIGVEALDTTVRERSVSSSLPNWLRPDWTEPVVDKGERLGTIAVIPEQFLRAAVLPEGALPGHKLRRVVEFIDGHVDQALRLEQLAAVAGVSPYHFHRLFKKSTGQTPHQYLLQKRIERAKTLLRQPELPLIEVAAHVGYADQSHFATAFRQATSMTPRTYRNVMLR
jgi:AraC-like DNA-binding protein